MRNLLQWYLLYIERSPRTDNFRRLLQTGKYDSQILHCTPRESDHFGQEIVTHRFHNVLLMKVIISDGKL